MKIFCDLDGTLINVKNRHYAVYRDVAVELNGQAITKSEYWTLKRQKCKWPEILIKSKLSFKDEGVFLKKFICKIEDPKYLAQDTLFPGVISALEIISDYGDLYLVSLRRNKDNLLGQLEALNIAQYFQTVLTGHSENDGYDVKIQLIENLLEKDKGIVIGDTEADVMTGKILGLTTVAVKTGIRDEKFLKKLEPDYLISDITHIKDLDIS